MKQLLKMRIFSLLTNETGNNQVTNEISKAYDEFAFDFFDKLKVESNPSELYYNLGFIRLELIGLRDKVSNETEKKFC